MALAERIFRILSLAFLSVGFAVSVAGTPKTGETPKTTSVKTIVDDVKTAQEINRMNASPRGPYRLSQTYSSQVSQPTQGR